MSYIGAEFFRLKGKELMTTVDVVPDECKVWLTAAIQDLARVSGYMKGMEEQNRAAGNNSENE